MKGVYLDGGLQIKLLYVIEGGLVIHACTISFQTWIFVKYSTTYSVNAVNHISRMAKFTNL